MPKSVPPGAICGTELELVAVEEGRVRAYTYLRRQDVFRALARATAYAGGGDLRGRVEEVSTELRGLGLGD